MIGHEFLDQPFITGLWPVGSYLQQSEVIREWLDAIGLQDDFLCLLEATDR